MRDRRPDQAVTRQALKRVRRLKKASSASDDSAQAKLSEWEDEFLDGLEERLNTYGSAFADPNLGDEEEALSIRQAGKLREVGRKVRRQKKRAKADDTAKTDGDRLRSDGKKHGKTGKSGNRAMKKSDLKRTPLKRKTPLRRGPKTESR